MPRPKKTHAEGHLNPKADNVSAPVVEDAALNETDSNKGNESHTAHYTADPTADRRNPEAEEIVTTEDTEEHGSFSAKEVYNAYVKGESIQSIADRFHANTQDVLESIETTESKRRKS